MLRLAFTNDRRRYAVRHPDFVYRSKFRASRSRLCVIGFRSRLASLVRRDSSAAVTPGILAAYRLRIRRRGSIAIQIALHCTSEHAMSVTLRHQRLASARWAGVTFAEPPKISSTKQYSGTQRHASGNMFSWHSHECSAYDTPLRREARHSQHLGAEFHHGNTTNFPPGRKSRSQRIEKRRHRRCCRSQNLALDFFSLEVIS